MKRILLTLTLAAAATFADAQGTVVFPRLRIEYCLGVGAPAPGELSFGLFAGPSAGSLSGQPVLPLGTNTAAGVIGVSSQFHQIPGVEPGSIVFVQIRGWETRFGLDWEQSRREGLFGETAIRSVALGPTTGPGAIIGPLPGPGEIVICPEPSTIALALCGLGSLLLLRRRKRF